MDRYVIREPRVGEYPAQGNQMIAFSPNTGNNMMPAENMAYYSYGAEFPMHRVTNSGFMGATHNINAPQFAPTNLVSGQGQGQDQVQGQYHGQGQGQGQVVSGIDPRYLASYADNNAAFIAGQQQQRQLQIQQQQRELSFAQTNSYAFDDEYQKRNFVGANRAKSVTFAPSPQKVSEALPPKRQEEIPKAISAVHEKETLHQKDFPKRINTNAPPQLHAAVVELPKNEFQNTAQTRADKLKALHRSGPRAFSGPVEKVLKWHKALQEIGLLVLYEIVAKCVNVRPGESCAKNLVIRDDSGPAMQVVYYEIDFMLPELKLPCTVRVIGRMLPGTCRLQAFNVRLASGDDVATLPRRAAVAAHHVAKLCKEYGPNVV